MNRLSAALAALLLLLWAAPLAAFDGIRLTLLGGGEEPAQDAARGPGVLVEAGDEVLLFDCGEGTLERLRTARFLARDLTGVFLTSLDSVHSRGCGEVVDARLRTDVEDPLPVWGPEGTARTAQAWVDPEAAGTPARIDPRDISENLVYDTGDVQVTAIVANSPGGLHAYGYRVDRARRSVVLLAGARAARGAQVVASDVAAAADGDTADPSVRAALAAHASPEEAGRILREARPYLAVYSHLQLFGVQPKEIVARTRRYHRGPLQLAFALMVVEIQNEVQVRSGPSDGPRR